jgi:hypothetical protein
MITALWKCSGQSGVQDLLARTAERGLSGKSILQALKRNPLGGRFCAVLLAPRKEFGNFDRIY